MQPRPAPRRALTALAPGAALRLRDIDPRAFYGGHLPGPPRSYPMPDPRMRFLYPGALHPAYAGGYDPYDPPYAAPGYFAAADGPPPEDVEEAALASDPVHEYESGELGDEYEAGDA